MFDKLQSFLEEKANHGLLKNGAKTALWLLAFLNIDHISNVVQTLYHDVRGSQAVREFWDGFVEELRRVRSRVNRVGIYAALGWLLSFVFVGLSSPKAVVVGLLFALIPQALLFGLAVKVNVWIEAYRAIKHQVEQLLRGVNSTLPEFFRLQSIPAHDEETLGVQDLYLLPYKAVFWCGVMHFLIALTAMVSGGNGKPVSASAMAAVLILLIVNIGVAAAGYVLGYGTKSAFYRKLAIAMMVLAPIIGLLKVAYTSYCEREAKALAETTAAEVKANEEITKAVAAIDEEIKTLVGNGSPTPDVRRTIAWKQEVRAWIKSGKSGAMPMKTLPSCADDLDNNNDGAIDKYDRSCGTPDTSCITGYEVAYVKGPNGKPVVDENGKKKVAFRKPKLAEDCRMFDGESVPRRYDPNLSEHDLPKPEKPATTSNGNGNHSQANAATPSPAPPTAQVGSNRGSEALKIAKEMGWSLD